MLAATACGLSWVALGGLRHVQAGMMTVASALLVAAVLRLVLPGRAAGLLVSRRRVLDVLALAGLGACLMAEPALVADCVTALRDAVALPVTVKHRVGIDAVDDYAFVRDFVGTVARAGATTFLVHARNAILKGLSPKENREVPPLKYWHVYALKRDFPELTIVINGGVTTHEAIAAQLERVDGVMLGRVGYHNPYLLAEAEEYVFGEPAPQRTRAEIVEALVPYAEAQLGWGVPIRAIARR